MSNHLLQDKVILLTGGSRGIGAGLVRRLAADGAAVAFTYSASEAAALALEQELTGQGHRVMAIQADSREYEALVAAAEKVNGHFGGLDVLVANAGVARYGLIQTQSLKDYDYTFDVNVRGVMAAVFAALSYLTKSENGRIITIGSINADRMPRQGAALYAASKAALKGLVKGLARDLADAGVTVVNVQPGPFSTDMNPDGSDRAAILKEQFIALKRYGKPNEIGGLVAYLASDDAAYITGTSIDIDGGLGA